MTDINFNDIMSCVNVATPQISCGLLVVGLESVGISESFISLWNAIEYKHRDGLAINKELESIMAEVELYAIRHGIDIKSHLFQKALETNSQIILDFLKMYNWYNKFGTVETKSNRVAAVMRALSMSKTDEFYLEYFIYESNFMTEYGISIDFLKAANWSFIQNQFTHAAIGDFKVRVDPVYIDKLIDAMIYSEHGFSVICDKRLVEDFYAISASDNYKESKFSFDLIMTVCIDHYVSKNTAPVIRHILRFMPTLYDTIPEGIRKDLPFSTADILADWRENHQKVVSNRDNAKITFSWLQGREVYLQWSTMREFIEVEPPTMIPGNYLPIFRTEIYGKESDILIKLLPNSLDKLIELSHTFIFQYPTSAREIMIEEIGKIVAKDSQYSIESMDIYDRAVTAKLLSLRNNKNNLILSPAMVTSILRNRKEQFYKSREIALIKKGICPKCEKPNDVCPCMADNYSRDEELISQHDEGDSLALIFAKQAPPKKDTYTLLRESIAKYEAKQKVEKKQKNQMAVETDQIIGWSMTTPPTPEYNVILVPSGADKKHVQQTISILNDCRSKFELQQTGVRQGFKPELDSPITRQEYELSLISK